MDSTLASERMDAGGWGLFGRGGRERVLFAIGLEVAEAGAARAGAGIGVVTLEEPKRDANLPLRVPPDEVAAVATGAAGRGGSGGGCVGTGRGGMWSEAWWSDI